MALCSSLRLAQHAGGFRTARFLMSSPISPAFATPMSTASPTADGMATTTDPIPNAVSDSALPRAFIIKPTAYCYECRKTAGGDAWYYLTSY